MKTQMQGVSAGKRSTSASANVGTPSPKTGRVRQHKWRRGDVIAGYLLQKE